MVFVSKMVPVKPDILRENVHKRIVRKPYVRRDQQPHHQPKVHLASSEESVEHEELILNSLAQLEIENDANGDTHGDGNGDGSAKDGDDGHTTSSMAVHEEEVLASTETEASKNEVAESKEEKEFEFMAIARVFCGVLRRDSTVFVYTDTGDSSTTADSTTENGDDAASVVTADTVTKTCVEGGLRLFTLMGRDVEEIEEASAGHVFGIVGLEHAVLSSATLSSLPPPVQPFRGLVFQVNQPSHIAANS